VVGLPDVLQNPIRVFPAQPSGFQQRSRLVRRERAQLKGTENVEETGDVGTAGNGQLLQRTERGDDQGQFARLGETAQLVVKVGGEIGPGENFAELVQAEHHGGWGLLQHLPDV